MVETIGGRIDGRSTVDVAASYALSNSSPSSDVTPAMRSLEDRMFKSPSNSVLGLNSR